MNISKRDSTGIIPDWDLSTTLSQRVLARLFGSREASVYMEYDCLLDCAFRNHVYIPMILDAYPQYHKKQMKCNIQMALCPS